MASTGAHIACQADCAARPHKSCARNMPAPRRITRGSRTAAAIESAAARCHA